MDSEINVLSNELKKVQNYRKFLYKILSNYLDILSNGNITYNTYLISENLKNEIGLLDNQGKQIVRKMYDLGWGRV